MRLPTMLSVCAFAWLAGANPVPLYPGVSFMRTMVFDHPYVNSYCLESGAYGTGQGLGRQKGQGTQPCAIFNLEGSPNLLRNLIRAAGSVDLGTLADIRTLYNIRTHPVGTAWVSIMFDAEKDGFVIANTTGTDPDGRIALQPMNLDLSSTTRNFEIVPEVGHVYIIRVTDREVNSGSPAYRTLMFVKMQVLATSDTETTLLWDVIYGDEEPDEPSQAEESEEQ
mmetsp:Transcript_12824/g.14425  ORF Transcript_12824/g.14425 Transcript_12824/m.14425 type:complete len:224 (-) Transcript_12824:119-790(-)